jgi:hypothetical protein
LDKRERAFGVVTNNPQLASEFELVFWETKDVGGVWHKPFPNSVPMVCSFADTLIANSHPEYLQRGADGQLATRKNKFFNYEWLCPSHPEIQETAIDWIRTALADPTPEILHASGNLRLDNVCFAREGYCDCEVCRLKSSTAGTSLPVYREKIITGFVEQCRTLVTGQLFLTVYPDPYPNHPLERFGLNIQRLKELVDVFVVPIFDTAYGTTYWLETIAKGFQDLFAGHPWYIELYGDGIEPARLLKAAQVANAYADGVLIAYASNISLVKMIQNGLQLV